jgi:hypothetical protein
MTRLGQRWRRGLAGIIDIQVRAAYLRAELVAAAIDEIAAALDETARAAARGDAAARELMAAALPALATPELEQRRQELRRAATELELAGLERLLGPDQKSPLQLAREAPPSGERPLTLGERKAMARRPSRQALDALMRDPHPVVIRAVLDTPRLTEDDVVRMAARRPGSAAALTEIARHPKWMLRPRVRCALVRNPATPLELALPILPLLRPAELSELVAATDAAPVLRRAAVEMVQRTEE